MTIKEVGDSFFSLHLRLLVYEKPYMAFVIMSTIIEFLGKCYNKRSDFQTTGNSRNDYCDVINHLDSLKKYQVFNYPTTNNGIVTNNNYLYSHLRCGMLHAFLPKKDIILSSSYNDLKNNIIGAKELYKDLQAAWIEIQQNEDIAKYINSKQAVDVNGEFSGSTTSNVIKIARQSIFSKVKDFFKNIIR